MAERDVDEVALLSVLPQLTGMTERLAPNRQR
jgi:hypothetical protein